MPSSSASTDLSLPQVATVAALLPALNDRMRQIEMLLGTTSGAASASTSTSSPATGQVVFSIPGTLGMMSNAAPLLQFANAVTPSGLVALLKQAAIGASVMVQIMMGTISLATLTIPAGQTQVSIPGAGTIPANTLVTLNLISVGTTFPGSGLSVILQGV